MKQIGGTKDNCGKALKGYQAANFEFQNGKIRVKDKVQRGQDELVEEVKQTLTSYDDLFQ